VSSAHSHQAGNAQTREPDTAQTRQRIIDAALHEFAAKGYAGARVREIAGRAGVNTQLISYYFGGKEGLYNEILATWHRREAQTYQEHTSFADISAAFVEAFAAQPELLRIFAWDGLTRGHAATETRDQAQDRAPATYYTEPGETDPPELADLRRRQAAGEIASDLDPGFLLLFCMGAAMATVVIPDQVERLCHVQPGSPEYIALATSQLRTLIAHLAANA
jgi:TetR/AcrR family transcriptional regulator